MDNLLKIDKKIATIVNAGLLLSLVIGIIGVILIFTYNEYRLVYDFYKAGFILIKTSIIFAAQFIACGLSYHIIIFLRYLFPLVLTFFLHTGA